MRDLSITTNIGCRNMCSYCPQSTIISAYKNKCKDDSTLMSVETFKKCLDKLPEDVAISFAGLSEPFLNPNCTEMIQYSVEKGFKVSIFTTSIGMTKEDIKIIETLPLVRFEFHLPDDTSKTNIKIDENFLNILKLIKESKIQNIHYQVFGKPHPKVQEVLDFEVEDLSRIIQTRAGNVKGSKPRKLKGRIVCGCNGKELAGNNLLPNGDIYICTQDYGLKHKFGNLLEDSYEDLFKSEGFKEIQLGFEDSSKDILCRRCDLAIEVDSKRNRFKEFMRKIGIIDFLYSFNKIPFVQKGYIWYMNKIRRKKRFEEVR